MKISQVTVINIGAVAFTLMAVMLIGTIYLLQDVIREEDQYQPPDRI